MPVKFKLYDQEIAFSDEQRLYNNIHLRYEEYSEEAVEEFKNYYKKSGNLDKFIDNGMEIGTKIIDTYIEKLLDELVKRNIYEWTLNSIQSKYGKIYLKDWIMAFDNIHNQYMEIVLHGEQLDAYRTARRENRGRWQGGGFGLGGAVKGAAMAGAMNLASGAVYGTANLIGKGFTMVGNSIKKSGIYNSEDTIESLTNGIMLSVYRIHFVLCDILQISTMPIDAEKSKAILENLSRIQDVQKQRELVVQGLYCNPYNSKLYKFAIENMKDTQGELQNFADFFGYKWILLGYKIDIIEAKFKDRVYSTLEQAEQNIQELRQEKRILGIPDSQSFPEEKRLLETRKKIEIDMRTIDNVLFDTIEDAESARQKKNILQQKLSQKDKISYEQALEIQQNMLSEFTEKEKVICQNETTLLEDLIKQLDIARRTYKDVLYDSVEERQQAVLDDEKIQLQLEEIWNSKELLKEKTGDLKIINISPKLRDSLLAQIDNRIIELVHKEKMEEIDEFFSSFNFEQYTSEGRQKAVEILSQVESKFSDVMDTNENVQKARQYIEKYDISVRQIEENNSLVFDSEEESRNLSRHKQRSGIIVGIFCCLGFFIPVVPFIVAIIYGAVSLSKYGQLKKDFDRKTLIREDGQRALRLLNRDVISENESKDLVKADNSTKDLSEASGLSCPNCKMWVSSENNFCPRCGTAITKNSD